jgi:hypothetical protein
MSSITEQVTRQRRSHHSSPPLSPSQIPSSRLVPVLLQLFPLGGALWAGASQHADYRAHGVDVLAGFAVGLVFACAVQTHFLGGLKRSYRGEDPTEVAEFLLTHSRTMDDPEVAAAFAAEYAANAAAAAAQGAEGGPSAGGAGAAEVEAVDAVAPSYPQSGMSAYQQNRYYAAAHAQQLQQQQLQLEAEAEAEAEEALRRQQQEEVAAASYAQQASSASAIAAAVSGLPRASAFPGGGVRAPSRIPQAASSAGPPSAGAEPPPAPPGPGAASAYAARFANASMAMQQLQEQQMREYMQQSQRGR